MGRLMETLARLNLDHPIIGVIFGLIVLAFLLMVIIPRRSLHHKPRWQKKLEKEGVYIEVLKQ